MASAFMFAFPKYDISKTWNIPMPPLTSAERLVQIALNKVRIQSHPICTSLTGSLSTMALRSLLDHQETFFMEESAFRAVVTLSRRSHHWGGVEGSDAGSRRSRRSRRAALSVRAPTLTSALSADDKSHHARRVDLSLLKSTDARESLYHNSDGGID